MKYAFIRDHEQQHAVRTLCRVLKVHPSGYYAWRKQPISMRGMENQRLIGQIKQAWLQSGAVYASPAGSSGYTDRCADKDCALNQAIVVAPPSYSGTPALETPNRLARQFDVAVPNQVWVTDITYIRTHEGWLYLAVV